MERRRGERRMQAAALALAAGLCAAPAGAGELEMEVGGNLYAYWCGSCHGADARGEGPLSLYLTLPVPDLTDLARRNGGLFPMLAVIRTIDGGDRSPGHGGEMPVFGALFADDLNGIGDDHDAMIEAQGRILSIAIYLSAIQR
ncbi:c-type cytochrome [Albimonas pacifica]|uniref:Cytochrome c domain-containing protein n=1 Tax=Albimonas pacifica TaxID=1114924 RepID=A0A1I3IXR0_9RHOB|nr:hypothetical protein [Albimonas pacifica]SFI52749.1 hypothetical protein SAMN05216258_107272 [Albimonas pacifica]